MGIGVPLALLAALGVILPIAAHLARQQDLPRMAFPALALLRHAEAESKERVRVKDRPLLLLRVLLIAALAFAAAAPFVWRSGAFADGQVSSLVLIVDDSMSMESALDDTQERALAAISALPSGSEVAVIAAGRPARVLSPLTADLELARAAVEAMRTGGRGTDLSGAATLASAQLAPARFARRVLTLSDFAYEGSPAWPRNSELAFERSSPAEGNSAVLECSIAPDPTREGFHSIRALVRAPEGVWTLQVLQGEQVLSEESVEVGPDGQASLIVGVLVPAGQDVLRLHLQNESDPIQADNTRELWMSAASTRRVLIIDGDPPQGEARFVSRALDVAPALPGGGRVEYRVVDKGRFATMSLDAFDAILMLDAAVPHSGLEAFVQRGGGLVVAAGPHVERSSLRDILPARIGERRSEVVHAEGEWPSVEELWASQYVELEPRAGSEVLVRWSSGSPALVADGGVAVFSSALDDDWSELPYAPGFVAFVRRLASAFGEAERASGTYTAGDVVQVPDGESVTLPNGDVVFHESGTFTDTGDVGHYQLTTGDGGGFVVVPESRESEVRPGALPSERRSDQARGPASKAPLGNWVFLLFGLGVVAEGMLRIRQRTGR
ncbi:MAG: BatA domain-containing protein [Polyangiales bacterium]